MIDREKVIKAIEICYTLGHNCTECPLFPEDDCNDKLMHDALALLKTQEAVKPKSKVRHGANAQIQHFCGNCNSMLHGKPKYCSECGKSVKWDA